MRLSVVVPCRNEEATLPDLHRRLSAVLPTVADDYEIILVDDGSTDGTLPLMQRLAAADRHVRYVALTRNFGQQIAATAGLDRARGDCVVLMDADGQDPPECIPEMVARWREGFEVVAGRRRRREGLGPLYRLLCAAFYRLIGTLAEVPIPEEVGEFRLLDRKVVRDLRRLRESYRFLRALCSWVGYRQTTIEFDRPARRAGASKYRLRHLLRLAMDVITGFSLLPLRLAGWAGAALTAGSVAAAVVLLGRLAAGKSVPGGGFVAAGLFFVGGLQLIFLRILGEYVGRTYREVQRRPLYLVREESGGGLDPPGGTKTQAR